MPSYDREEKYKTILKGLKKLGLEIKHGKNHTTATCPKTDAKTTLPRHTPVGKFIVGSICDFLMANGYTEEDIKKAFKW
jgi:spore germination protein YaaH